MTGKKTIKIQTDSEEGKDEKTEADAAATERKNSEGQTGDTGRVENDDPIKDLEAQLETVEQEAKENYDRLLRVSAEFENYKKRTSRELGEFRKFANQSLINTPGLPNTSLTASW